MAGGSMINERNLGELRNQHNHRKYQLSQDTYGMLNMDGMNQMQNMGPGVNAINPLLPQNF